MIYLYSFELILNIGRDNKDNLRESEREIDFCIQREKDIYIYINAYS